MSRPPNPLKGEQENRYISASLRDGVSLDTVVKYSNKKFNSLAFDEEIHNRQHEKKELSQEVLEFYSYKIIRFQDIHVFNNMKDVMNEIEKELKNRSFNLLKGEQENQYLSAPLGDGDSQGPK